jgi:lipoate-protein ligase A
MHRWIQAAFRLAGLETELAPHAVPCAGQCFAGYEQFDLLCQGRKIAGAAQRRNRSGLLIQGSVQPAGLALERERWEAAMLQVEPEGIAVKWEDLEVDEPLATRTEELKKRKYSQPGWICRR